MCFLHFLIKKIIFPSKSDVDSSSSNVRRIWKVSCCSILLHILLWLIFFSVGIFIGSISGRCAGIAFGISLLITVYSFIIVNGIIIWLTNRLDLYETYNHPDLLPLKEFNKVRKNFNDANKRLKLATESFHNCFSPKNVAIAEKIMIESFMIQEKCRKILKLQYPLRLRCIFKMFYGFYISVHYDQENSVPIEAEHEVIYPNILNQNGFIDAASIVG